MSVVKGGAPYVQHPLRMMLSMSSIDERIVAALRDVCEDCSGWRRRTSSAAMITII
jgi:hypothetical protein